MAWKKVNGKVSELELLCKHKWVYTCENFDTGIKSKEAPLGKTLLFYCARCLKIQTKEV